LASFLHIVTPLPLGFLVEEGVTVESAMYLLTQNENIDQDIKLITNIPNGKSKGLIKSKFTQT
jgi:hypothetical protein